MAVKATRRCMMCNLLTSGNPRLSECNCVRSWKTPDGKLASSKEYMDWFKDPEHAGYALNPNGTWSVWTTTARR